MLKVLRHVFEWFELTLPLSLSTGHGFRSDLPAKACFELEEAPCLAECLITSIPAHQKERRQHGQHDRASHTLAVLRDLPLTHGQPALQCLDLPIRSITPHSLYKDPKSLISGGFSAI